MLFRSDGFAESLLFYECQAYVLLNLKLHFFILLRSGVDRHVVVLDGQVVLLLLEEDVAHVHSQTGCLRVLLVFQDNRVTVNGFLMKSVCVVHICQVVENVER